jgi:hypothetical protein
MNQEKMQDDPAALGCGTPVSRAGEPSEYKPGCGTPVSQAGGRLGLQATSWAANDVMGCNLQNVQEGKDCEEWQV